MKTELFNDDGHLNQSVLISLADGIVFDELERLEISEHLSFCDVCLSDYLKAMDNVELTSPCRPITRNVTGEIQRNAKVIFINKCATVAIAACFAIGFWTTGFFSIGSNDFKILNIAAVSAQTINHTTENFATQISSTINNILDKLTFERGYSPYGKK